MDEGRKVKVALQGPDGDIETLWADPLGGDLYALDNLPWYAYGVSVEDVVEATPGRSTISGTTPDVALNRSRIA
jgi:hypothetical protein